MPTTYSGRSALACIETLLIRSVASTKATTATGGEDTDFAFAARAAGVPFFLTDAPAYHQHHATYSPPYNHLGDLVTNANAFKKKWGDWPMEGWLSAFRQSGHIRWEADTLELLRAPTEEEIRRSRSTDPFA